MDDVKILILSGLVEIDIVNQEESGLDGPSLRCQGEVKCYCPGEGGKYQSGEEILFVLGSYDVFSLSIIQRE